MFQQCLTIKHSGITDLAIRGNVAMSGVLGYELDLSTVTDEEKAAIKEQVAFYKKTSTTLPIWHVYSLC